MRLAHHRNTFPTDRNQVRLRLARGGTQSLGALGEPLDTPGRVGGEPQREAPLDREELCDEPGGRAVPAPLRQRPLEAVDGIREPLVLLVLRVAVFSPPSGEIDDLCLPREPFHLEIERSPRV